MNATELDRLHFTKLRAMLAEKGLGYTDKAAAIAVLAEDAPLIIPVITERPPERVKVVKSVCLDRSRPFGEVFGDADARYAQDNHLFDGNGMEIA